MRSGTLRLAILAEQNFNLIDGSTIWLLNICRLAALLPRVTVTLLLRVPLTDRTLADDLPPAVQLLDPAALAAAAGRPDPDRPAPDQLEPEELPVLLAAWEGRHGAFDRILVRGTGFLAALLADPGLAGRLIGYAPGVVPELGTPTPDWLTRARDMRLPLIVQSRAAARVLETLADYPAHALHVVPPIVLPDAVPPVPVSSAITADPTPDPGRTILGYSGKVDADYGLAWLIGLARNWAGDPGLGVSLILGKDSWRDRQAGFFAAMDEFRADVAAGHLPGVELAAGLPHGAAKAAMARADFAWCLRDPCYDDVIETSTKVVEYCTFGVAPILNDTALNRELFGADYPYLLDPQAPDRDARITAILRGKGGADHARAQARLAVVAERFAPARLLAALDGAVRGKGTPPAITRPRRILLATHEDKFLRQFLDRVAAMPLVRLTREVWLGATRPAAPPMVPDDVDTVFCEWCCENAVWHSQNKRPGTRLIVRLHRFEVDAGFPARVDWGAVDRLIVVSDHFRDLMVMRFGVDPARIVVWPQYIDWHELQRPKLPAARFTIGMVGINPFGHKRLDRAVNFLAALRAQEPRFSLAVRSVMPWQIDWVWNNRPEERAQFQETFARIHSDPLLAGAVRFDPAGPDMEEWYRGIGTILSSSDFEGCHTAVMEGMASGCLPVVHDWPGARGLFAPHVHADLTAAIPEIITFAAGPDPAAGQEFAARMRPHDVGTFTRDFFQL